MIGTKKCVCAGIACALLLAAGCTPRMPDQPEAPGVSQAPLSEEAAERIYALHLDLAKVLYLDRDGNEVEKPDSFIVLEDQASEEPRYQYLRRDEDTGVRDEWGWPEIETTFSLYDMEGEQLLDWEGMVYQSAFGEYIIRQEWTGFMVSADEVPEDYYTALYHVPTGTDQYLGVFRVQKIGDNFLLCDEWGTPLGIVDVEGNAVSGFPVPKTYYGAFVEGDYFTASLTHPYSGSEEQREVLLDANFQELYSAEWLSAYYGGLPEGCFSYQDGGEWGVIQPGRGVIFTASNGASIEYFDGERAIVQSGYYRSEEEPINASLVTADGVELAGGFSWLSTAQRYDDKAPAEKFLAISGGEVVLLDQDGARLASAEVPNARNVNALTDSLYTCWIEDGDVYGTGLLDQDLNLLIAPGRYSYIELMYDYQTGQNTAGNESDAVLLRADKQIGGTVDMPGNIYRTDILAADGTVIMDNVSVIYDMGPDRIALQRGFDVGLIDTEGNWIVKQSIFRGLGDD